MTPINNMISGDFYCDTESAVRGLELDVLLGQPDEATSFGKERHDVFASPGFDSAFKIKTGQLEQGTHDKTGISFQGSDLPPQLPDDDGFVLSKATAIYVTAEAAWRTGNRLLAFLDKEIQAHVKQVNRMKFTINADVLCQSQTCVVKVRVYRLELSAQALSSVFEFQRQGGDSLAFSGFFRKARQCLCASSSIAVDLSYEAPRLPSPVAMLHADFVCLVTPLIDAACHAECRSLQASAAAGLAEAAENSPTQICTDSGFVAIQRLMQAETFEVSSQVSRLLSRLVASREADAYFTKESILHLLLYKIRVMTDGRLLRRQLAQELQGLAKRTDAKVSPQAAHDLAKAASA